MDQSLSSRLTSQAGVIPSPDWLEACRSHLAALDKENTAAGRGGGGGGVPPEDDEDEVLHHVLHSDLRDVVRRLGGGEDDGRSHPGQILRQAILASLRPGGGGSNSNANNNSGSGSRSLSPRGPMHDAVVTPPPPPGSSNSGSGNGSTCATALPPDFCLLLQAEECTDVARNAEGRLGGANAGGNGGPPNQQQQQQWQGRGGGGGSKRLLKILGSDGYYAHGLATPPAPAAASNNDQQQQLQEHSIVLMETAPIPALSADAPSGIKLLLHSTSPEHPITVRRGIVQIHPGNCTVLGGHVPHLVDVQRKAREMAQRRAGVGVDASSSTFSNPYASSGGGGSGGAANPYASSAGRPSTHPYSSAPAPAPASRPATTATAHGTISSWMAASLCSPEGSAAPSTGGSVGRPSSSTSTAAMPAVHAAASSGASGMDLDNSNHQGPTTTLHGTQDSASTAPPAVANGSRDASSFAKATPASTSTGMSSGLASSGSGASTPGVTLGLPASSGAYTEPLSFSELRSLLLQIKSDRSVYERYQDKTFIVPCKLNKSLFDFRFEKIRSSKKDKGSGSKGDKKKSSKEYEFCLTVHLNGTVRDGDAKFSARFASRLIEPFYSVKPTDLRKMHKEDKERANKLASEGSTQVISEYSDLTPLHMKLLLSAKDYFAQTSLPDSIDGSTPLVVVTGVGR